MKKVFNGYYVTPDGELYNIKTGAKKYTWKNKGRCAHYERAQFIIDGKKKNFYLHRIVAQMYLQSYDSSLQVNHINGNTLDNRAENLEMTTVSDNQKHHQGLKKVFKTYHNCIFKEGIQHIYRGG